MRGRAAQPSMCAKNAGQNDFEVMSTFASGTVEDETVDQDVSMVDGKAKREARIVQPGEAEGCYYPREIGHSRICLLECKKISGWNG